MAIGLLRSIQHLRTADCDLDAAALADPIPGLANRPTFCRTMHHHLALGATPFIAIFAVDRMRALLLQYGQEAADEIRWGFAQFLTAMTRPDQELAHLDCERFAVILPGMNAPAAGAWVQDVLHTFNALALGSSSKAPQLTASAGMAQLVGAVDSTLRQAEVGLVIARAGGGQRLGRSGTTHGPTPWTTADAKRLLGTRAAHR